MPITKESYTRLTLALDIVRRIDDGPFKGYHELGTIKHRIDLSDTIRVEESGADSIECDDPMVPLDGGNVCLKAADLLRKRFGIDRSIRITITKRIPVMGGLAGGSANAATTIELLNELWDLRLGPPQLADLGRMAGMDVPYFFTGGTAFDSEAGLRLEPIDTRCVFTFVLACPEFGVSTRDAYAGIDYSSVGRRIPLTAMLREFLSVNDPEKAVTVIHNDFEPSVFSRFPRLPALRRELLDAGCLAAFMSGSGSTIVGVARDFPHAGAVCKKISVRTIISSTKR